MSTIVTIDYEKKGCVMAVNKRRIAADETAPLGMALTLDRLGKHHVDQSRRPVH